MKIITIVLSDEQSLIIDHLRQKLGVETEAELFQKAIALLMAHSEMSPITPKPPGTRPRLRLI